MSSSWHVLGFGKCVARSTAICGRCAERNNRDIFFLLCDEKDHQQIHKSQDLEFLNSKYIAGTTGAS